MTMEGTVTSLAVEGAITAAVFEAHVNEEWGCELLYLLLYSPDFNPTLRRLLPRSRASYGKPELAAARH
jgi:hypothetical protein